MSPSQFRGYNILDFQLYLISMPAQVNGTENFSNDGRPASSSPDLSRRLVPGNDHGQDFISLLLLTERTALPTTHRWN
jgi:hypothetical protein